MAQKGILVVISGPAGSGKGTVNAHLLQTGDFAFSVSATTRAPRPGEIEGVNYHFITKEDFLRRIADGDMLEYTEYCGNYYGTPRREAEAVLESGKNLILEIEVDGAMQVKSKYPDAVLIMLLPPSYKVQEDRLRGRGTETEQKILERLEQTKNEVVKASEYDYIVYNRDGESDKCAEDILAIVRAEQLTSERNPMAAINYFAD